MKTPSKRSRRIADMLLQEITLIITKHIADPRLQGLLITAVDMSPDLKNAKIFFTLPDALSVDEANGALRKASGFLRTQLAKTAELRHAPKLIFMHDKGLLHAERLSQLIDHLAPAPLDDTDLDSESL